MLISPTDAISRKEIAYRSGLALFRARRAAADNMARSPEMARHQYHLTPIAG